MTLPNNTPSSNAGANYRSANNTDQQVFGGPYSINTPMGVVHTQQTVNGPPLPPRPAYLQPAQGYSQFSSPYSYNSYGGFGGGLYNSFSGYGSGYGGYSSYFRGMNQNSGGYDPMDPESRFIQMAEESSRSTFQSIESVVSTIGNIATMLDSTYFALTSSFRAVLGVAANFSRLRGFFAQFFSTFAIFRSLVWLYRKILYALGLSNINPATVLMNEAFNQVQTEAQVGSERFFGSAPKSGSGWPILMFLAFIMSAPYLIMKLYGSISQAALEESKNPKKWVNPIHAEVLYTFMGENPSELRVKAGQKIKIAPREIQQANRLLQTHWLLATVDNKTSGLIPVNYIKRISNSSQSVQEKIERVESNNDFSKNPGKMDDILEMEPVLINDNEKLAKNEDES